MTTVRGLGRIVGRVRGVRLRITLVATFVAALAVLAAGLWLVRAVEGSLTSNLKSTQAAEIAQVSQALAGGSAPSELNLQRLTASTASGQVLQVVVSGHVVASSPGIAGLPPLDETVAVRADGVDPGPVAFGGEAQPMMSPNAGYALTRADVESGNANYTVIAASPLDPVRRSVSAVEHGLAIALPLLVVAVALLTWFLTGRALRPVEEIRAEVESITGSTLSRRVPVPDAGDEVARLARTMNAMLDRLEESSTRQQQFVADASHELRSPVAAIRTELEVARHSARADEWPGIVDQVLVEEARLEATITDLLLLATLDEGAPAPAADLVDLSNVVEEAARRRGDTVLVAPTAGEPVVSGSHVQLTRAVGNLVDNAVRHARSSVVVGVAVADGIAVVTVDDDGPGIPEADRERVFERFTRLDGHRARTGSDGGAGLGLSLVRAIAERHGGDVSVTESASGGARFVLRVAASPDYRSNVATTGA